jgi:hypothetical protein
MPLYVHADTHELRRVVPDRPDRPQTEARRLAADPLWHRITDDELRQLRECGDTDAAIDELVAARLAAPPPAPAPARKSGKAAAAAGTTSTGKDG